MSLLVRLLLVVAAFITSFFVARDALNFEIVQMIVGLILFTSIVFVLAFWPKIKNLFYSRNNKKK